MCLGDLLLTAVDRIARDGNSYNLSVFLNIVQQKLTETIKVLLDAGAERLLNDGIEQRCGEW